MDNMVRYFISIDRAYRSEIALYRREHITAEYCAVIEAPEGTKQFYAVEERQGVVSIWTDMLEAFATMKAKDAQRMHAINVIG